MKRTTHGAEETQDLARQFVVDSHGLAEKRKGAFVVGLYGDLGAGKTTFSQGLAAAFDVDEHVTSPTFVIEKVYELVGDTDFDRLIHIDAYRLAGGNELQHIGWQEVIADPRNFVLVEWADKVDDALPEDAVRITFRHAGGDVREISW